jgi:simple sugar transport system permease protein
LVLLWPMAWRNWTYINKRKRDSLEWGPTLRLGVASLVMAAIVLIAARIVIYYAADGGGSISAPFFEIMNGKLAFVAENYRSAIVWWLVIAAIFWVILTQTNYGNAVFAAGGNAEAARAQGVNVRRVKVANFVICGMLAAVAGITEAARFKVVEPLRGTGYELDVVAAVVIGGTLLTGGYGSIIGSVLGILIAFMLKTGLVLVNVPVDWFRGVLGIIMIIAVVINTNIRRQR